MRTKTMVFGLVLASLSLLLSVPSKADTFQFTYTVPAIGLISATNLQFTITAASLPTSGIVGNFTMNSSPLIIAFSWNSKAGGNCFGSLHIANFACAGTSDGLSSGIDEFAPGAFLQPGTYNAFTDGAKVVITDLSTAPRVPEPSTGLLLSFGVLAVLAFAGLSARRKHGIASCGPHARAEHSA